MDNVKVGKYIKKLRKEKGLTQEKLSKKLNVSFQAISKWENGETMPDVSMLLPLAEILNTSVDKLLNGGNIVMNRNKLISIKNVVEGFEYLEKVKECFNEKSTFWQGIVEGISNKMNFDFNESLKEHKEVLYTEVVLQYMINENCKVDMDEVCLYIKNPKMVNLIKKYQN